MTCSLQVANGLWHKRNYRHARHVSTPGQYADGWPGCDAGHEHCWRAPDRALTENPFPGPSQRPVSFRRLQLLDGTSILFSIIHKFDVNKNNLGNLRFRFDLFWIFLPPVRRSWVTIVIRPATRGGNRAIAPPTFLKHVWLFGKTTSYISTSYNSCAPFRMHQVVTALIVAVMTSSLKGSMLRTAVKRRWRGFFGLHKTSERTSNRGRDFGGQGQLRRSGWRESSLGRGEKVRGYSNDAESDRVVDDFTNLRNGDP